MKKLVFKLGVGVVLLILITVLISSIISNLNDERNFSYLYVRELYNHDTQSWTGEVVERVQTPYGFKPIPQVDNTVLTYFDEGYLFSKYTVGDDLILNAHNMKERATRTFNFTSAVDVKPIPYSKTGGALATFPDDKRVFIYDGGEYDDSLGKIEDVSVYDGDFYLEMLIDGQRQLLSGNLPYADEFETTFDIRKISGSFGFIAGSNNTGHFVVYANKRFGDEYAEIIQLYDGTKFLVFLARTASDEYFLSKRRVFNVLGLKFFGPEEKIQVADEVFVYTSDIFVVRSGVYFLGCNEAFEQCSAYKDGDIIEEYKGRVYNMVKHNDHVYYTVIDGKHYIPVRDNGKLVSIPSYRTFWMVI